MRVSVEGTRTLLDRARFAGTSKIIYFSSSEIYGDPVPECIPTPETYWGNVSCLGPRACYDESKRLGETICSVYQSLYGVPVSIVRPFNVYGPGGLAAQDFRVIPAFLTAAFAGKRCRYTAKGIRRGHFAI